MLAPRKAGNDRHCLISREEKQGSRKVSGTVALSSSCSNSALILNIGPVFYDIPSELLLHMILCGVVQRIRKMGDSFEGPSKGFDD